MLIERINDLPNDLVIIIKSYLPKSRLIFLNKYYYKKYHYIVKNLIHKNDFEPLLRNIIRHDNDYVFSHILIDFHHYINKIQNYKYKNVLYKNYFKFLIEYCIQNNSVKCRNILNDFLKVQGLCQNRHKKNSLIHIRWKH
jgi:hypothetical protein